MKCEEGIAVARLLRGKLLQAHLPVRSVILFGSVARGDAHEWSDIDVAIVCDPFDATRHDEAMRVRLLRRDIDIRISPVCFHPEDFSNRLFGLAQEIQRTGVEVH